MKKSPATVHFPIAFWGTSFALNAANYFTPGIFPKAVSQSGLLTRFMPPLAAVPVIAHYANGAGLLTATVSIATGVSELMGMWKGQADQKGGYMNALKDAYAGDPNDMAAVKLKTTFTHATLNDLVCRYLPFLYTWYLLTIYFGLFSFAPRDCSRSRWMELLQTSNISNVSSATYQCLALGCCSSSILLFGLLVNCQRAVTEWSSRYPLMQCRLGCRGGSLVYEHAVGVQRQGKGPEIAKKQQ